MGRKRGTVREIITSQQIHGSYRNLEMMISIGFWGADA